MLTKIQKKNTLLMLLTLTAVCIASFALAQARRGPELGSGKVFENEKVKTQLDLTDDQVTEITDGFKKLQRDSIKLRAEGELLRMDLEDALDAKKIDEVAINEIIGKMAKLHEKQLHNRITRQIIIKETLTDEQQEKMDQVINRFKNQRRGNAGQYGNRDNRWQGRGAPAGSGLNNPFGPGGPGGPGAGDPLGLGPAPGMGGPFGPGNQQGIKPGGPEGANDEMRTPQRRGLQRGENGEQRRGKRTRPAFNPETPEKEDM